MFLRKVQSSKVTHIWLVAMAFDKDEGGWSKRKTTWFSNKMKKLSECYEK